MIKIDRYSDHFTVNGHAGYAPHGRDIVCAAVSTLLQAFIVSVEELTTDDVKAKITAGNALILHNGNLSERATVLVDSFFIGVTLIANTYPDFVKLTEH